MTSTHPPGSPPVDPAGERLRGAVLSPDTEALWALWRDRAAGGSGVALADLWRTRCLAALDELEERDAVVAALSRSLAAIQEELDGPPVYDVEGVHPSAAAAVETTSLLSRVLAVFVVMSLVAGALALGGAQ